VLDSSNRTSDVPPEAVELGYPANLKLPASVDDLLDPKLPGIWRVASQYVRNDGLRVLLTTSGVWGIGVAFLWSTTTAV
jgi:hypothetical protein